ncbi:hypothetical protein [Rhodococcus sp. IEGM 1330]|uniref:hypothetical protein n=1 Tax=Rhodococcus sp. IEGM 1330 TaxID=3082225 RepID=UPI002955AC34|nr:hypothetical protein [Rhodococcus sp. IEGM 1330]MDV8020633.1 hypothetical protein [Rhodococcus sp. IEGM 1330]
MSTPPTGTDHPRRTWRQWRIPAKIYGRVRTSTVAFGMCFVLTGLWYGQVSAEITKRNEETVQGPVAVDPGELVPYTPSQTYEPSSTTTTTPETSEPEPSGGVDDTGTQSTTTAPPTTTTAPFGVPIPPAIQSLIPTQPAPTTSR